MNQEYSNTEILDIVNDVLKNDKYKEFSLAYVLKVKDDCQNCYAVATDGDRIIGFNPFESEIYNLPDWDFNIDTALFEELEGNREIIYMSMDCHYGIWFDVSRLYPNDIEHKEGMQKYLKYCKKNKIDFNKIQKVIYGDDIKNIMKFMENKNKERGAR